MSYRSSSLPLPVGFVLSVSCNGGLTNGYFSASRGDSLDMGALSPWPLFFLELQAVVGSE